MNFTKLNRDNIKSEVQVKCQLDNSKRVLIIQAIGRCRNGSDGGINVNKIFLEIVANYFWIEPSALIFDFRELEYEFGNSIIKLLDFTKNIGRSEFEKNIPLKIVLSDKNKKGISSLLQGDGKLPGNYYSILDEAITDVSHYLEE